MQEVSVILSHKRVFYPDSELFTLIRRGFFSSASLNAWLTKAYRNRLFLPPLIRCLESHTPTYYRTAHDCHPQQPSLAHYSHLLYQNKGRLSRIARPPPPHSKKVSVFFNGTYISCFRFLPSSPHSRLRETQSALTELLFIVFTESDG